MNRSEEIWTIKLTNKNEHCETMEEKLRYKSALAASIK